VNNLIDNGDFSRALDGWEHENGTYTYVQKGMAWLAWGSTLRQDAALSQRFPVQNGTTYGLTYKMKGGGGIPNHWRVEVNGEIVEQFTDMFPPMDWQQRNFSFTTPASASDAVLTFWYRQVLNSSFFCIPFPVSPGAQLLPAELCSGACFVLPGPQLLPFLYPFFVSPGAQLPLAGIQVEMCSRACLVSPCV
jgi:Protein of unknown function (DUF642)